MYNSLYRRIKIFGEAGERWRFGCSTAALNLLASRSFKHPFTAEEFVKNQPQRINVTLDRNFAASQLLRRHVSGCSGTHVPPGEFFDKACQTKVRHANRAETVDHDVVWFKIAMEHALVVGGGKPRAQLAGNLNGLIRRRLAHASKNGGEILAVNVFHRDEMLSVGFRNVVNAAYVGMRNLASDPDLVMEPFELRSVVRERRRKELERDGLPQLKIVGAIDLSHPALAE